MNKQQKAKLQSNQLVVKEARSNADAMNSIPAFAVAINSLDDINKKIGDHGTQQQIDQGGVKTEKDNVMGVLVDWMSEFAGSIHSIAVTKGDVVLRAKVDFSASKIEHMNPVDLITNAKIILDIAKTIAPDELLHVGLSEANLLEFENSFVTFSEIKSSSREAVIERAEHTSTLASLFGQANDLLTNIIDRLALQYRRTAPDYYAKIKASRNVVVTVSHKTKENTTPTIQPTN